MQKLSFCCFDTQSESTCQSNKTFKNFQTQIGNAKCLTKEGFDLFLQILAWKRSENLTTEQINERLQQQGYIVRQNDYGLSGISKESLKKEFVLLKEKLETAQQEAEYFRAKFEESLQELKQARQDAEESRQRQDTIILHLTRQLQGQTKILEHHQAPWWKRWFKKQHQIEE